MPTPAEIQAQIVRLRGDEGALQTYLRNLPAADVAAWQQSAERINASGPGGVSAAVPYAAPLAVTAAGATGAVGAAAGIGSRLLGPLVGPTRASRMADALGPIGENTIRVIPGGRTLSPARIGGTLAAVGGAVGAWMGRGGDDGTAGGGSAPGSDLDPAVEGTDGGAGFEDDIFARLKAEGYRPVPGRPGVFFNPETQHEYDINGDAESGAASAATALGWAQLARQQGRDVVEDEQWRTSFDEGKRQFQANYDRSVFTSDRAYRQAEDQFAKSYAENRRQFDTRMAADLDMFDTRLMSEEGQFQTRLEADAIAERARLGMSAEQMALDAARFDRQIGLEEKKNRQEVLRNPSDFVSRAFESRGEVSPEARITHADLINEVARDAYAARTEGATAVANARRMAESVVAPKFTPTPRIPRTLPPAAAPAPAVFFPSDGGSVAPANGVSPLTRPDTPDFVRMEHGGHTQQNMAVVGDSSDGKENEELVIDLPNDGGLMVIPKDRLVGKRKRMAGVPRMQNGGFVGHDVAGAQSGSLPGGGSYYRNPDGSSGTMGDVTPEGQYTYLQQFGGLDATRAASISGWTPPETVAGVSAPAVASPVAPMLAPPIPVSQADLVAGAKRMAPPAVRDLVGGPGRLAPFRPAVSALTPRRLSMLNSGEQEALNSYMGLVHNTTLEDELSGIAPLFGPSVTRARSRMAVGG